MRYLVYDVFTDTKFSGNPLAIVFDAADLETSQMQAIAAEFGYSETTFVLPPEAADHTARVRIFTPTAELAFAGHPTVGTATALFDDGGAAEQILELGVGPIPVRIANGRARFVTRVPLTAEHVLGPNDVARCVGLDAGQIRTDRHAPVLAGLGTEFTLAELSGMDALRAASSDAGRFRAVAGPEAHRLAVFVYVRDGDRIAARMFQPLGGITEDPATGSAVAALAAYLGRLDGVSARFEVSQGVEMGRPSRIDAEVTVENGAPVAVAIEGAAVRVMEGHLIV
ncbi:MAG: PhzF family phenazine biosynthesis protein [Pseudomonadota bacterium]